MTACDRLPIVVVGGGPAGAAAACRLAAAGRQTVLLERESAPRHKVCGEFLSAEVGRELAAIGIDPARLGAVPIRRVRLIAGRQRAEADLPFPALGLSRWRLDEALLRRAAALGVDVRRGTFVRQVEPRAGGGWGLITGSGEIAADTLFLASGKHDLRPFRRVRDGNDGPIGFKIHMRLSDGQTTALRETVELILFEGGYAGLQLVDQGTANLCLLVRKSTFAATGQNWRALLDRLVEDNAHLAARLDGAAPQWPAPLAIASLPFGYLARPQPEAPALYPLGDRMAVIPAFCGDGIAIALHTGGLAASCHLAGESAAIYTRRARRDLAGAMAAANRLSWLAAQPWGGRLAIAACRVFPPLLSGFASGTRIRGCPP